MTTRDKIYIPVILILIGMGLFSTCHYNKENRQAKRDIKTLQEVSKRNFERIDSLKSLVAQSDKQDSILVEQTKALYITKTNADVAEIITMPADSFLLLLTEYINRAGKPTN